MEQNQQWKAQIKWQKMSTTLRNLCKIKIDSIFQTTIRLMNKNSHLSPFSSSSVAEATIEEKEKTFEMILRHSKFKECTLVLLSILKQNHVIYPWKHFFSLLFIIVIIIFHGIQVLSLWRYNIKIPGEPSENTPMDCSTLDRTIL